MERGRRIRFTRTALVVLALVVATSASACRTHRPTIGAWTFDELSPGTVLRPSDGRDLPDSSRQGHRLRMHPVSDAAISVVGVSGRGSVLDFPDQGHAALTPRDSGRFDPGPRDFEVAVWLSVTADQIGPNGANVIQKGLGTGSMWKLEIDGGVPACGYVDTAGQRVLWPGRASRPVTDGAWYLVTCRKTSTQVSISVQRAGEITPRPDVHVVSLGSISNDSPVTVGAKESTADYDQFRGRLDDVAIRVI